MKLTIDGTKQSVASTDIIEVNNENVSDINVGLIKLQNFDLPIRKICKQSSYPRLKWKYSKRIWR